MTEKNKEINRIRKEINYMIDPIWKSGSCTRTLLYDIMAKKLRVKKYRTAEIRSIEFALDALRLATMLNENYLMKFLYVMTGVKK